jgi:hypothetical protein
MTPRQAATLKARIEARWPEATEVQVRPDSDGARVRMTVHGEDHMFSVAEGGALMRLLLTGSALPKGAPGAG